MLSIVDQYLSGIKNKVHVKESWTCTSQRTTVFRMEKNVKQPLSTHELYAQKIFILDLDLLSLSASPLRCIRPLEITVFCSTEKSDIFSPVEKWAKESVF